MSPRLIIVSNRVAVPEPENKQMAGGLAVAVKAALRNRTGVWFGWSGKIDEMETAEPRIVQRNRITYAVIDLSKNDFDEYYNGLANRVLWPILHCRVDLQKYSRRDVAQPLQLADHVVPEPLEVLDLRLAAGLGERGPDPARLNAGGPGEAGEAGDEAVVVLGNEDARGIGVGLHHSTFGGAKSSSSVVGYCLGATNCTEAAGKIVE